MCYFLFRPVKWSKRTVWTLAGGWASYRCSLPAVFRWAGATGPYSGWPMSIAAGVIVRWRGRMAREAHLAA
jgi:hypothetical protein